MALFHILAGTLGLLGGVIALYAVKGAKLHRSSGVMAAYALLLMSASGVWLAFSRHVEANAIGGILAGYLIFTALLAVGSRPASGLRWTNIAAMVVALVFGLSCVAIGFATLAAGKGQRNGIPVPLFLIFGSVALLAGVADWRWIRSPTVSLGRRRVVRHLWRMCCGLFIATSSFFLGPDSRVPEPLRIPVLRVVLALLPLGVMLYWLARTRGRVTSGQTT